MEACGTLMSPVVAMLVAQHVQRKKNRDSKIIFLPVVSLNCIGTEDIEVQGKFSALKYSRDKPSHLEMHWAFTGIHISVQ